MAMAGGVRDGLGPSRGSGWPGRGQAGDGPRRRTGAG